jgi:predicted HD phosphohydrolase
LGWRRKDVQGGQVSEELSESEFFQLPFAKEAFRKAISSLTYFISKY